MKYETQPTLPAPENTIGLVGWLRKNLFSNVRNSIATIVMGYFLLIWMGPVINWVFIDANWLGTSREDCTAEGACWVFISQRIDQFLYGFYPGAETWRLNLAFFMLVGLLSYLAIPKLPVKKWVAAFTLLVFPV
ncbi:MAG: hypothetical protein R3194_10975, partial [Limnobacter sp.]|nr:hypothetical protein [Limnobacter sp.]